MIMNRTNKKAGNVSDSKANYFLCVRVTDPQVYTSIKEAIDWILDKDNQYEEFCYTPEMLHVTICEICLETEEDIHRASQALEESSDFLLNNLPVSQLQFKGLTTFFEKVLVADVQYENDFRLFCETVTSKLKDAGVNVVERHEFKPHMTIMKVNTMRAKKAKVENINPWLYVNLKKTYFGDQAVNSVHLCQMGYDRREDGFYKTPAEIFFRS
ncbi:A-kinase anchor protein 7 isoform gamma [Biomphalaria glabrata]|nr:leukocyte receptor cluster member 9-like [Biomphalaria glabrata]